MGPPEIDANGSPTNAAIRWVFGQPAYIVLLCLSLFAWWYNANYTLPQQNEKMEERRAAERREYSDSAAKAHSQFSSIIEKVGETVGQNTRVIERLSDKLESKK